MRDEDPAGRPTLAATQLKIEPELAALAGESTAGGAVAGEPSAAVARLNRKQIGTSQLGIGTQMARRKENRHPSPIETKTEPTAAPMRGKIRTGENRTPFERRRRGCFEKMKARTEKEFK
jgi:hypothetical protein